MGNTPPKIQTKKDATLQQSPKSRVKLGKNQTHALKTLQLNTIQRCKSTMSNQSMWRNHMQHHLARLPYQQCHQNVWHKKLHLFAKERTAMLKQSNSNPKLLIHSKNGTCDAWDANPESLGMQSKPPPAMMSQSTMKEPSCNCRVNTNIARCNVFQADVYW